MKIFILCPLPEEQKPINEYIRLKETQTINWTMVSQERYLTYLSFLYRNIFVLFFLVLFLITTPCVFRAFTCFQTTFYLWNLLIVSPFYPEIKIWETFLTINQGSIVFLLTLFGIVCFIWLEASKNLKKSYVVYEEGSWYQVQRWEKPLFLIKNDRLLNIKRLSIVKGRMLYSLALFGWIESISFFF